MPSWYPLPRMPEICDPGREMRKAEPNLLTVSGTGKLDCMTRPSYDKGTPRLALLRS